MGLAPQIMWPVYHGHALISQGMMARARLLPPPNALAVVIFELEALCQLSPGRWLLSFYKAARESF